MSGEGLGARILFDPRACPSPPTRQPVKDWHFDIVLLQRLVEGWQAEEMLGACYCVPPIGSFVEHVTGCSVDRPGRIPGHWGCKWQQDGTRVRKTGELHRWLAGFTKRGQPEWLGGGPVRLLGDIRKRRWPTEAPPGFDPQAHPAEPEVGASVPGARALRLHFSSAFELRLLLCFSVLCPGFAVSLSPRAMLFCFIPRLPVRARQGPPPPSRCPGAGRGQGQGQAQGQAAPLRGFRRGGGAGSRPCPAKGVRAQRHDRHGGRAACDAAAGADAQRAPAQLREANLCAEPR